MKTAFKSVLLCAAVSLHLSAVANETQQPKNAALYERVYFIQQSIRKCPSLLTREYRQATLDLMQIVMDRSQPTLTMAGKTADEVASALKSKVDPQISKASCEDEHLIAAANEGRSYVKSMAEEQKNKAKTAGQSTPPKRDGLLKGKYVMLYGINQIAKVCPSLFDETLREKVIFDTQDGLNTLRPMLLEGGFTEQEISKTMEQDIANGLRVFGCDGDNIKMLANLGQELVKENNEYAKDKGPLYDFSALLKEDKSSLDSNVYMLASVQFCKVKIANLEGFTMYLADKWIAINKQELAKYADWLNSKMHEVMEEIKILGCEDEDIISYTKQADKLSTKMTRLR